jgi:phenylacetate-CoA ligase
MMDAFPRLQLIQLYQKITGRRILECLDELNRTQWLSRAELLQLQHDKLYKLLEYASEQIPYYQRAFDRVGFRPADILADLNAIRKIPVLTKALIRENLEDLLSTDPQHRQQLSPLTTGGSTGEPLAFMQDSAFRDHVTADIHRHLGWASWRLGQVHAYIWGADFEVAASQTIRAKTMNWALNRFVTNAYALSEESMTAFATQIRRRRPRILLGYPSSMCTFARFVQERSWDDIKFDAVFSSAEMLYPGQRQFLETVFLGGVFDRYGTRELGGIACECKAHTGLHASIENVYIEILQNGEPAKAGEAGEIIVTNLNNYGMPFVRYSVGDVGAWHREDACPCGRELPMMELRLARHVDMFKMRDGRVVWGAFADEALGARGIKRFQLVQKSLDHVVARIVRDLDFEEARLTEIESNIKIVLGDQVTVEFEFPDEIPVSSSGKYRYAISEVDKP